MAKLMFNEINEIWEIKFAKKFIYNIIGVILKIKYVLHQQI